MLLGGLYLRDDPAGAHSFHIAARVMLTSRPLKSTGGGDPPAFLRFSSGPMMPGTL